MRTTEEKNKNADEWEKKASGAQQQTYVEATKSWMNKKKYSTSWKHKKNTLGSSSSMELNSRSYS